MKARIGHLQLPESLLELLGIESADSQFRKLEARVAEMEFSKPDRAAEAARKLALGQALGRTEAAVFLGVSTKKLQRMEVAGTLRRCPGLGSVVRYAARDVLGLASASSRKGA